MPYINGIFIMEDSYYLNTPFYIPAYNSYHNEPQIPLGTYIHPESAAGQLGLTPTELALILEEQHEFM
jgi:hypothetical protein